MPDKDNKQPFLNAMLILLLDIPSFEVVWQTLVCHGPGPACSQDGAIFYTSVASMPWHTSRVALYDVAVPSRELRKNKEVEGVRQKQAVLPVRITFSTLPREELRVPLLCAIVTCSDAETKKTHFVKESMIYNVLIENPGAQPAI